MRIARKLSADQETIHRFLTVFGGGMIVLSSNNQFARPEFFIQAHTFIKDFIVGGFFKKEELLIEILADVGFPSNDGPIGYLRDEQKKSHEAAAHMLDAAKQWQAGDENTRVEVGWASSKYSSTLRQHLERIKTLILPLIEQNIPLEEEHKISERIDAIVFDGDLQTNPEKYAQLIVTLEEELADWR